MDDDDELQRSSRAVNAHGPVDPAAELEAMAAWCRATGIRSDLYGRGEVIERFETKVAALLGYPAARFLPSGTMAQQIAVRVWCDRAGVGHFGMHPTSHLELHEDRAYAHLHGLTATLVGPMFRPLTAQHLAAVGERL